MWRRKGVVEVVERRASAGAEFLIVRPCGWVGDDGWIMAATCGEQLRALVGADEAEAWLGELRAPITPRPPGDLVTRRARYERTIERGTPAQQVAALAHTLAEAHRPDVDDVRVLDRLERLVVAEIAAALGRDPVGLAAELRAGRPRFADGAVRSGSVVEAAPIGPPVPPGCEWISSFEVGEALDLIDLDRETHTLPAQPGTWHAIGLDDSEEWFVVAADRLATVPFDPRDARVVVSRDDGDPFAILDGGALDPLVEEELRDRFALDLLGRGVAIFPREGGLEVRAVEADGRCVAIWAGPTGSRT